MDHFCQQVRIEDRLAANAGGRLLNLMLNPGAAMIGIHIHPGCFQTRPIVGGMFDFHRPRMQNPVALG